MTKKKFGSSCVVFGWTHLEVFTEYCKHCPTFHSFANFLKWLLWVFFWSSPLLTYLWVLLVHEQRYPVQLWSFPFSLYIFLFLHIIFQLLHYSIWFTFRLSQVFFMSTLCLNSSTIAVYVCLEYYSLLCTWEYCINVFFIGHYFLMKEIKMS